MRKWQDISAIFTIVAVYLVMELVFGITCPILFLTGISCAGCGMSRAWFCLLRLDVAGAFSYHPLFWIPPVAAVLFLIRHKLPSRLKKLLLIITCTLFLVVYILRMLDTGDTVVVFQPENGALYSLISALFTKG